MKNPIPMFQRNIERIKEQGRGQYIGLCPFHEDTKHSFSFNEEGQYQCFSCGEKGNAITFARLMREDEKSYYTDDGSRPVKQEKNRNKTNGKQTDIDVQALVDKYHKDWTDSKHKNIYQVGECNGHMTFTYWHGSKPIGIHHHKSKPHWEGNGTAKWYGEWQLPYMDKNKPLVIVEGEGDVITMADNDINSVSGSAGCRSIPQYIPNEFYDFKTIIILYDQDEYGDEGNDKLYNYLKKEMKGQRILQAYYDKSLPKGFDCSDENGIVEARKSIAKALELPTKMGAFKIMTDEYMSNTTPPPAEWIVEKLLPKDFNSIVAGTTGARKSYFVMTLAMNIANGDETSMGFKIHNTNLKVLYVDTENDSSESIRRYQNIKKNMDWKDNGNFLYISKGGETVDIWDTVDEIMENHHRADLIVIDSLYNSTVINDFSKSANVTLVNDKIARLKHKYKCTSLSIGHFNKGGNDMGLDIDRMSGASALKNSFEFVALMTKANIEIINLWTCAKVRGFLHDQSVIAFEFRDFNFVSKGVITDYKELLVDNNKKAKWMTILEDLPQEFHVTEWLNVFSSKFPTYSDRTGRAWLYEARETVMVNELVGNGNYEKGLSLLDSENIEEE
mgnify:FL=1